MRTRTPVDDLAGTGLHRDGPSVPCPAGPVAAAAHHHARSAGVRPSAGIAPRSARVATIAGMGDDPHAPVAAGLENLKIERDAIVLYDALAEHREGPRARGGVPPHRRDGASPRGHLGDAPGGARGRRAAAVGPRIRVRFIIAVARRFGTPVRLRHGPCARGQGGVALPGAGPGGRRGARGDRRGRGRERRGLAPPGRGGASASGATAPGPCALRRERAARDGVAIAKAATGTRPIVRSERWHRRGPVGHAPRDDLRGQRRDL